MSSITCVNSYGVYPVAGGPLRETIYSELDEYTCKGFSAWIRVLHTEFPGLLIVFCIHMWMYIKIIKIPDGCQERAVALSGSVVSLDDRHLGHQTMIATSAQAIRWTKHHKKKSCMFIITVQYLQWANRRARSTPKWEIVSPDILSLNNIQCVQWLQVSYHFSM